MFASEWLTERILSILFLAFITYQS